MRFLADEEGSGDCGGGEARATVDSAALAVDGGVGDGDVVGVATC